MVGAGCSGNWRGWCGAFRKSPPLSQRALESRARDALSSENLRPCAVWTRSSCARADFLRTPRDKAGNSESGSGQVPHFSERAGTRPAIPGRQPRRGREERRTTQDHPEPGQTTPFWRQRRTAAHPRASGRPPARGSSPIRCPTSVPIWANGPCVSERKVSRQTASEVFPNVPQRRRQCARVFPCPFCSHIPPHSRRSGVPP